MARKPLFFFFFFFFLLWDLTLSGVSSLCNVACSTDYNVSLNCSCSGSAPAESVHIEVKCSDEELEVNGTCEVKPTQPWCIMYPEMLFLVASIGTQCTASVIRRGDRVITSVRESSSWALSDVVKPLPPVDVQLTNADGFYNITWDHDNQVDCLMYTVRIRDSRDLTKDPVHVLSGEQKCILLDRKLLPADVSYLVDVQAKMCPGNLYEGPCSEWSSPAECRTSAGGGAAGFNWRLLSVPLSILFVFGLLGYFKKTYFLKKIQMITYIPTPDKYFKPDGNFKEWAKPAFSEYDYLRVGPQVPMKSEKLHDAVLQWNNEKRSFREEDGIRPGDHFLQMPQPRSNSLPFLQDAGGSQGTGQSAGHISIHTVTLYGEEEFEQEVGSQSSVNTLRHYGESFGGGRERAGRDSEEPRASDGHGAAPPHHENQISNDLSVENFPIQLHEAERVSLDSFASNGQSEDGYPHVDLDTIDSGFGECSSPGASDSNMAEQMDSGSFHEHKLLNSNYVRQWMVCSTNQDDSSG